jgi:hypothetical protein
MSLSNVQLPNLFNAANITLYLYGDVYIKCVQMLRIYVLRCVLILTSDVVFETYFTQPVVAATLLLCSSPVTYRRNSCSCLIELEN